MTKRSPRRHGSWPDEYPRWVLEEALKEHGWKERQDECGWYRTTYRPEARTEFWNQADAYPFYPQTQHRLWRGREAYYAQTKGRG